MTTTARARRTDPETSHEAAESVSDITAQQGHILTLLEQSPMSDDMLVARYQRGPVPTPQSIRSRRAELVAQGLVEHSGEYVTMVSGRRARVWRVIK
jgi:hypothetical protein